MVEPLGTGIGRDHDVFEPQPEPPGEIDAGLDAERVARDERFVVAGDDVGIFVRLDADAVPGAVDETFAETGRGDDRPGRGIHLRARRSDARGAHCSLLRLVQHRVGVDHLCRWRADVEHARDVGAVVVHRAAEVAQHDVAVGDHPSTGFVMRAGGVVGRAHDREVGVLVPELEHPLDELTVHVDLGAAAERSPAHVGRNLVDRGARRAQRRDLVVVLDLTHRPDDRRRARNSVARQRRLQIEHESGPRLVADRDVPAPPTMPATSAIGSPGSSHGTISKLGPWFTAAPRAAATTSRASPRAGARAS